MKKAIVWGVNLGFVDKRGCPSEMHVCEGLIYPNLYFAKKFGAVYWDHCWKVSEKIRKSVPMSGYIYAGKNVYDVPYERRGTICFRATIKKILTLEELLENSEELKYVPEWRKQCLNGVWNDGTEHERSPTWFKLSHIKPLSRGYSPREFGINADFVRRGVYVEDKNWR